MRAIARRIRGILGLALAWSVPWAVIGGILGAGLLLSVAASSPLSVGTFWRPWLLGCLFWGGWGFATGATFAVLLTAAGGRQELEDLSLVRFAFWGGLAGLLPAIGLLTAGMALGGTVSAGAGAVVVATGIGLGAACGTGSLMLARSGEGKTDERSRETLRTELPSPGAKSESFDPSSNERVVYRRP